jgi:hypothetical protein
MVEQLNYTGEGAINQSHFEADETDSTSNFTFTTAV